MEKVWGRRGIAPGRLQKPRAITVDSEDHLYIVDMTARIQVFDGEGELLRFWQTPAHENGRPTGISVDRHGNIVVADTHYFRVLFYSPEGELLRTIGGEQGHGPGQFGFLTDVAEDREGNYFVSEYGEYDRIQKFTHDGKYILEWGSHGSEPGQFARPQCILFDADDHLWVSDACNHRIQIFDTQGKLLRMFGQSGSQPGDLSYPYGMVFDGAGHLYVCEYGNDRIQKFTLDGKSLGCWGTSGHGDGELFNPWSLALDHQGRLHVLDSNNHRVQRIRM